ncbi:dihydroxyacetone kinase subunit DhaL [Anaerotalea alkaliphila]|uniref:phosphoenolpyruvate--glycerone phosphotransferase n=1 Tax=Anaerotalea alkaliphila TaxID=2662126 RepID=A0A7X5KND6_9FIRM|nr:dihydroxyacetone kinase subunit DhaL [Anaerotalea alkaliphila]NDL67683.1 dihydroxyacetone kinase subunit L [Anaerotalea alkaliphila]
MESFKNQDGKRIVENLIKVIQENRDYLSKIDGEIGDGDHGINMNKGFSICQERIEGKDMNLTEAFKTLAMVLMTEIGGSMGPLYGTMFIEMAKQSKGKEEIDKEVFRQMLASAIKEIQEIGNAKVGDKTLMDTLIPALEAYEAAMDEGFATALEKMSAAAERGKDSTIDLVAKIGRASRLGERSRGVLDAGATSCWLMLKSMADSMVQMV